jgi:hypothetical protein
MEIIVYLFFDPMKERKILLNLLRNYSIRLENPVLKLQAQVGIQRFSGSGGH